MYIKKNYGFWMTVNGSKKPLIYGALYAGVVVILRYLIKQQWGYDMSLPWQPVSVVGIAVAFYLGFKNNVSYERTWEARKIWGSIVNNSRSFTTALLSFVEGDGKETKIRRLVYRHIAWLITMDYQLRLAKEWEHEEVRLLANKHTHKTEAYYVELAQKLTKYLDSDELDSYLGLTEKVSKP